MTNNPETKRYCWVCFKKHTEEDWRWNKLPEKKTNKRKGKAKYYCHYGIDCIGCKRIHSYEPMGGFKSSSKGTICRLWFNSSPTLKQRLSNMSPEEVVSGGLHGLPNQFQGESEDYTSSVAERNKAEMLDALR